MFILSRLITIIVLLILAGVSISMLTGENGILTQAQRAKEETEEVRKEEENILDSYKQYIEGSTNGGTLITVTGEETENTKVQDSLGNEVTVPAGFKVVNPGDDVEDGIVIEDVTYGATKGSQFVWIPVGKIKTRSGEIVTITLDRYQFDENGKENSYVGDWREETPENNSNLGNVIAKDITTFISDVNNIYKGYYIARYEARTMKERIDSSNDLTQLVVNDNGFIYNYVTQEQAANLSRSMYSSNNFTSDLCNGYAWDTATLFIQKCSGDNDYSRQNSLNTELAKKGTINLEKSQQDVRCNIWDMSSNCRELITETAFTENNPCVGIGGYFYNTNKTYTNSRGSFSLDGSYDRYSFRPILYL